ncbi:DUF2125 domain-containing protein [Roseovarius sp. M141]|uniref:DUF2125 domain-containing protein n=1 Tax=Roseovarius sp. M141 TaxID=2583806 RepID=UPI0020CBE40B|nr:DUF2125 domain-containing protein [Roseovarius sp. M141]MCQ0093944.1 DUF2125 domain-containing protein [Roseovarius sp. M141]
MRILLAIVITLAAAWAGYWFIGSAAMRSGLAEWFDARRAEGWVAEYGDLSVQGFPNRFDTTLTELELADPTSGLGWQAPFFQVLTLSYTPNHLIAVWPKEQQLRTPLHSYALNNQDMRASLVLAPSTALAPQRITLTAKGIALTPDDGSGALSAATLRLAGERTEDAIGTGHARYHLGLAADGVALPAPIMAQIDTAGALPRVIDTVMTDATVDFDVPWDRSALEEARPQPTRITIKNAQIRWGAMTLAASGVLAVDLGGRPDGTLTLTARNWRQMLDAATRAGALTPDMADTTERALSVMSNMGQDPKSLEVPLRLAGGRIWIGPLPIGPAPILRLR